MERRRLSVAKRAGAWGLVYIIGGTEADGEMLPVEQADDLIARFEYEQALFGNDVGWTAPGSASILLTPAKEIVCGARHCA